jgi:hypothetical protein
MKNGISCLRHYESGLIRNLAYPGGKPLYQEPVNHSGNRKKEKPFHTVLQESDGVDAGNQKAHQDTMKEVMDLQVTDPDHETQHDPVEKRASEGEKSGFGDISAEESTGRTDETGCYPAQYTNDQSFIFHGKSDLVNPFFALFSSAQTFPMRRLFRNGVVLPELFRH